MHFFFFLVVINLFLFQIIVLAFATANLSLPVLCLFGKTDVAEPIFLLFLVIYRKYKKKIKVLLYQQFLTCGLRQIHYNIKYGFDYIIGLQSFVWEETNENFNG